MKEIEISYHKNQNKIFYESKARFKIVVKGRRFGLTKGMMNYAIETALDGEGKKILWVDTTYSNIKKYIQRYGSTIIKQLPSNMYKWNQSDNVITFQTEQESIIDFKSADKPQNMEGFGYNLILINEAGIVLKNENLWLESIRPMMLDYKADAIIGGTPKGKKHKGKDCLFYKLSKKENEKSENLFPNKLEQSNNYETFNFSTYDNPLLDKSEIDMFVSEISPVLRDQEVFGKFTDAEKDRIIKREWWEVTNNFEIIQGITGIYQSWDTAFKKHEENDYSVCTTWKITNSRYYLIDIFRGRLEFPELKKKAIELNEKYRPNEILIEDKASGISLIQELKSGTTLPIKAIKVNSDKVSRVHAITPIIESGNVCLNAEIEIINEFINECEDFPNSEFDDMVDSLSQALGYFRTMPRINNNEKRTSKKIKRIRKIYK